MENQNKKLGLFLLVGLGVGSMIGGGIFNSPTDLISKANPLTTMLAWVIGGLGVAFLALVFQMLANNKPELTGGIFMYAREGFGNLTGFFSAWGYWISAWLGNVAFFILLIKTLNSLVGTINPYVSFLIASALLWIIHSIQTRGTKKAGIVNAIATVAKIIPLLLVIVFGLAIFKSGTFNVENWKITLAATGDPTTVFSQVKGAMGTILWCFIGIEASTVMSARATSQKEVGKGTILSLIITLFIYMMVSVSAMGAVPAKELAGAETPLATVLQGTAIGTAGAVIVKLGIIISLTGALISWIMLTAEIPFVAAKGGAMPEWFGKENSNGAPVNSLLATNIITQIFLLSILMPVLQTAYNNMYTIATTTVLIPYLLSAMFAFKVAVTEGLTAKDKIISILACIYAVYVIYAVGIKYVIEALILYAIGIFVYYKAKNEKKESITSREKCALIIIAILAVIIIMLLAAGKMSL